MYRDNYINSSAWVLRCSFLTGWANARASNRGTGDRVRLPRFFTYTFNPDHSVDIINVTDGYGSTYNFKYVYYKSK